MECRLSLKRDDRHSEDDESEKIPSTRLKTPPKRQREDVTTQDHRSLQRAASESPTGGKYKPCPPLSKEDCERSRNFRRRQYLSGRKSTEGEDDKSPRPRSCDSALKPEPPKQRKDTTPMRLRPLPKSFWEQPKSIGNSSLAGSFYNVLPPLFPENSVSDNLTEVRPVTPPGEEPTKISPRAKRYHTSPPNTELLNSLFNHLEKQVIDSKLIVRRGRPKKDISSKPPPAPNAKHDTDPYIVDAICETLFPQLSLNGKQDNHHTITSSKHQNKSITTISLLRIGEGDNVFETPSVSVEHDYQAMLSELITHI